MGDVCNKSSMQQWDKRQQVYTKFILQFANCTHESLLVTTYAINCWNWAQSKCFSIGKYQKLRFVLHVHHSSMWNCYFGCLLAMVLVPYKFLCALCLSSVNIWLSYIFFVSRLHIVPIWNLLQEIYSARNNEIYHLNFQSYQNRRNGKGEFFSKSSTNQFNLENVLQNYISILAALVAFITACARRGRFHIN